MKLIYLFIFVFISAACSTQNKIRDQETGNLERPPGVTHAEPKKSEAREDSSFSDSGHEVNKGLYADVYTIEDQDKTIMIKRKLDDAWALLGEAIRLNELKITGKNQKNGSYEVSYKSGGLLDGFSLLGSTKESIYLLKLDEHGNETAVNISKKEDENDIDSSRLMDGAPDFSYDNSVKLLDILFNSLQKEVRI